MADQQMSDADFVVQLKLLTSVNMTLAILNLDGMIAKLELIEDTVRTQGAYGAFDRTDLVYLTGTARLLASLKHVKATAEATMSEIEGDG